MHEQQRLERARLSLEGLSIGDALGGFFEMSNPRRLSHFVLDRKPPSGEWRFTDDTNMALSVFEVLRKHQHVDQDALAKSFVEYYDRSRGYGRGMRALVARIAKGQPWREASYSFYGGEGSLGNGGAMRVAPVGGYFADDIPSVVDNARASAEITHAHPEGIAGAIAIAVAAAVAHQFKNDISYVEFIDRVVEYLPAGEVEEGCTRASKLKSDTTALEAATELGNGSSMTAQRTVPLAIWFAAKYRDNFEEAIWQTLSAGGDTDTTCAMVGGIVALVGMKDEIPATWRQQREPLPAWAFDS